MAKVSNCHSKLNISVCFRNTNHRTGVQCCAVDNAGRFREICRVWWISTNLVSTLATSLVSVCLKSHSPPDFLLLKLATHVGGMRTVPERKYVRNIPPPQSYCDTIRLWQTDTSVSFDAWAMSENWLYPVRKKVLGLYCNRELVWQMATNRSKWWWLNFVVSRVVYR